MFKNKSILFRLNIVYSLTLVTALTVMTVYTLRSETGAIDQELSGQLSIIAELTARDVATVIRSRRPGFFDDRPGKPYRALLRKIKTIQEISGFEKIVIIGRGHSVIMDSSREHNIGESYPFLKLDGDKLEKVWQGETQTSRLYRKKDEKYYKSAYAPVFDDRQEVIVIVRVEASVGFIRIFNSVKHKVLIFIIQMVFVVLLISVWLSRSIINPLNTLISGFEAIGDKRFSEISIGGGFEFEYLGGKFNEMVRSLYEKDNLLQLRYYEEYTRAEHIKGLSDYILEGIANGVIYIGPDENIRVINKAAMKILKLHEQQLNINCRTLLANHEQVLEMLVAPMRSDSSRPEINEITVVVDNETRWLSISGSVIYGNSEELLGSIIIFTDLTEFKLLQDEVAIQKRLAAIGELSAGIAHELRNPLAAIQGFVELIKAEESKEKRSRFVKDITHEIKSLDNIVSEFLEFARQPKYEFTHTDIREIITLACSFSIPHNDSSYHVDIKENGTIPKLSVDPQYMERVFINLIKNARESMPEGGAIVVNILSENSSVIIDIADTGTGIDAESLDKIFDPFYTTKRSGSGLGLAISHKTVQNHGGSIYVKKTDKNGTVFQVSIPVGA